MKHCGSKDELLINTFIVYEGTLDSAIFAKDWFTWSIWR